MYMYMYMYMPHSKDLFPASFFPRSELWSRSLTAPRAADSTPEECRGRSVPGAEKSSSEDGNTP